MFDPARFLRCARSRTRAATLPPLFAALLAAPSITGAAPDGAPSSPAHDALAGWVRAEITRGQTASSVATPPSSRIEIRVGAPDARMPLAPCDRVEPFLLPGVRLWGNARIGVRCVQGAQWSTTLPVVVSVFGPALVARGPMAAGAAVSANDFMVEQRELNRELGIVVGDPATLEGKVLARPIAAGQALKADGLRVPPVFVAGDPIRIRVQAEGFSISAEGVALNPAAEGQQIRVRTEQGRIVTGIVRDRGIDLRM